MNQNPYESPQSASPSRRGSRSVITRIGASTLLIGLVLLAYGAFTFWIMPSLPPNTAWSGRLPSLYCMGAGIFTALIGLTLNSLQTAPGKRAGVPTGLGNVVLVAIVVAFFLLVSRF